MAHMPPPRSRGDGDRAKMSCDRTFLMPYASLWRPIMLLSCGDGLRLEEVLAPPRSKNSNIENRQFGWGSRVFLHHDRKGEKSSDCVERSRFELSGPLKGHRKSWAENFQGMWRFDVQEGTGESVRPDNICEK